MDKVLGWAVAQQTGDKEAIARAGTPDPKMLNQLFGGVDEPTLMKQAIAVVENPEATLENKEIAFENFLMLIEDLDNANNIENMKMWPSIVRQLKDADNPLSLRIIAASIVGVAVQNNPTSQEAFLKNAEGVSVLINIASSAETQGKLLYKSISALSSLLNNCSAACKSFLSIHGYEVLALATTDDAKLLVRLCILIGAILSSGLDAGKEAALRRYKVIDIFDSILVEDGNPDTIDLALNNISRLRAIGFEFSDAEISTLRQGLDRVEKIKDQLSEDDLGAARSALS